MVIFTGALAKHLAKVWVLLFWGINCAALLFQFDFIKLLVETLTQNPKTKWYFEQDDPKVHAVVEKLLDVLNTPSEAVQRAVSMCLSPLMQSKQVCERVIVYGI